MSTLTASSRNGVLLGIFAAVTATAIAWTELNTREQILQAEKAAEARQLMEIFPAGSHDNSLVDDRFTLPAGTQRLGLRRDRQGYRVRQGGRVVGVILPATAPDGYSGDIRLLVGVRRSGEVAGVRVTTHRETPGLGDAIDTRKSDWILGFNGRSLSNPAPKGWTVKKDGGAFDQFTGATITPRAVTGAVYRTLEYTIEHHDELFATTAEPTKTASPTTPSDSEVTSGE